MSVFPELTSDNDWVLGAFATGDRAILLDVVTACQEWLRDCWWNQNGGIDWLTVLGGGDTTSFLKQQISETITKRQGVSSIKNLTVEKANPNNLAGVVVSVTFTTIYETELSTIISNV
jgi:hypothetical protein